MTHEPAASSTTVPVTPADRAQIVDALFRFGAGQDLRDRTLFDSAFSSNAKLDFTRPAERLGAEIPVFDTRQTIGDTIFAAISSLDTTHTITNPRITAFDGEQAALFALVEAQHLPRGDHRRHLLLKNFYWAELSRRGAAWVIDRLRIENVWMTGDPSVLFPA
jgi:SnoaL-like domain